MSSIQTIYHIARSGAAFILYALALTLGAIFPAQAANTNLDISEEVFGTNTAARINAELLDNAYGQQFPLGAVRPDLFEGGSGLSGSRTFSGGGGGSYRVDWQLGTINDSGPGTPTSTVFTNATGGSPVYNRNSNIQGRAPSPDRTDTRLSTSVNDAGLSAVRFDFSSSPTPISQFGIFVGDLESRANNGTEGRVILYDAAGSVIGDHPIRYSGTVVSSGGTTTYTSVEPVGSPSGAQNNNAGDWGNDTTAFLTITSDMPIAAAVIHVGDDDHTTNNTGTTEEMGLVGFQVPSIGTPRELACDGTLFQIASANSTLNELTFIASGTGFAANLVSVGSAGRTINAGWGYNELDNYIYGVRSGTRELWRVDANGIFTQITTLDDSFGNGSFVGDILPNGTMIYRINNTTWQLADLSDPTNPVNLGRISLPSPGVSTADFALNPGDGHIYGIHGGTDQIFYVDVSGGAGSATVVTFGPAVYSGGYGAIWFDIDNRMYIYDNNTNEISVVNVGINGNGTGNSTLLAVNSTDEGGINDGAYCRGPAPVPLGNISGVVYNDVNGSDIREASEASVGAGVLVSAYFDNGTPLDTSDDRFIGTTETLADGTYLFDGLATIETYRIEVDPTDSDLPPGATLGTSNPLVNVAVSANTVTTGQDFGFDPGVADLSLTKTANVTSAAEGDTVVWTISITNEGSGAPGGVRVLDLIPNSFEYISDDAPAAGDSYDPSTGVWVVGEILVGATETLNITTRALGAGNETNYAEIISSSLPDIDSDFNVGRLTDDLGDNLPDDDEASFTVRLGPMGTILAGRIINDNGAGSGTAHDAIANGTETTLQAAQVSLFDSTGTLIATPTVQVDGTWSHTLPQTFTGEIRVSAVPQGGWLLVSEQTTGLPATTNVNPYDGTFSFTPVMGENYTSLDIGVVAEPTLTQNQVISIAAGQAVEVPHVYTATSTASVTFAYVDTLSNQANAFSAALFQDLGCNGTIDTPVSAPIVVTEGAPICLISRVSASPGAGINAQLNYGLTATTLFTSTAVSSIARNDDMIRTGSGSDELTLSKTVRNISKGTPEGTTNSGDIGDILEYRLTFSNPGVAPIVNITVNDRTPAYTALSNSIPPSVVVAGGITCSVTDPASMTAGYVGDLEWTCPGTFAPGQSGSLTFQVEISP